mmetsp:Transcript_80009/g.185814  ORF Transcript_80009/g.185814 Transcript_80009/m.185814 type:complete len:294 (-) Transcript_80009:331-1212(-)
MIRAETCTGHSWWVGHVPKCIWPPTSSHTADAWCGIAKAILSDVTLGRCLARSAQRCQHGALVDVEPEVVGCSPVPITSSLLRSTLESLCVSMALADLASVEPVPEVRVDVRCECHESTRMILDNVRLSLHRWHIGGDGPATHTICSLLEASPDGLGNRRRSKADLHPPVHDPVALVWSGVTVVIVALTPETPEELRLLPEPVLRTDVGVVQAPLGIRMDLGHIRIDCQPAVRREASAHAKNEYVRLCNELCRLHTTTVHTGVQLRPAQPAFVAHAFVARQLHPWQHLPHVQH